MHSMIKTTATGLIVSALVFGTLHVSASASEGAPTWQPQSSERLIKLPARYMAKSLDQGFADSTLGQALTESEHNIGAKSGTLNDLQAAVGQADGDMRLEMRHQLLAEKRAYLELMTGRNDLRRQQVDTKLRVLEDALDTLSRSDAVDSPVTQALMANQDAARARFAASQTQVDLKAFENSSATESKYATKYHENMAAIEQLMGRITQHTMTQTQSADGESLTKEQYLRQMVVDAQAQVALIDQEDTLLGYMAKLVALDALALSEEVMDAEYANAQTLSGDALGRGATLSPAKAAHFFLKN